MKENWWKYLITSISFLGVGIVIGLCFTKCSSTPTTAPVVIHDTITRTDTLIQERVMWKYRTYTDSLLVIEHDTVHDTIRIFIPIDHYQYHDTIKNDTADITLDIYYQGYKAKLDTVQFAYTLYPQTVVQTKKKGWGPAVIIGAGAGTGMTINPIPNNPQPVRFGDIHAGLYIILGWGYHW